MTKLNEVYKCELCGNIVEMVHAGDGELVCCGAPMKLYEANTVDAAKEKHVPVIEKTDSGIVVRVGSQAHPMAEDHYIEWIELMAGPRVYRVYLSPGAAPEATFASCNGSCCTCTNITARAYCNKHGLWSATL